MSRGQWVWLVDLGCDRIRHYRHTDTGLMMELSTDIEAGAGPRHMTLHPTLPLAFVLCELQSRILVSEQDAINLNDSPVQVYSLDLETSGLSLLQDVVLSSSDGDTGAEILIQVCPCSRASYRLSSG